MFLPYLLLCRVGYPIDQQILYDKTFVLVDIVEQVSSTSALISRELGFQGFAVLGAGSLIHSFERVQIFVRVDLEDNVLTVPASQVVELVYTAACDHLC